MGAHVLAIKDMAGLCRPYAAEKLVKALRQEIGIPIHFHTHDTSGLNAASVLKAAESGVHVADGAIASMSGTTSQPNLNSIVAALQRLVLAQTRVGEKANEIVAIPALLDMLSIDGAVVTIDAMGCQREIASKIIDKKADYILALKGDPGTLREDVELFANEQKAKGFPDTTVSGDETVDGDHGRIETRRVTVVHDVAWLERIGTTGRGTQGPHHRRERARDRDANRTRDPLLPDLVGMARRPAGTDGARSLGGREQPALGHGHDLPRRRVPHSNRPCPGKLRRPQTHGGQHRP